MLINTLMMARLTRASERIVWPVAIVGFWLVTGTASITMDAVTQGRWSTFWIAAALWATLVCAIAVVLVWQRVRFVDALRAIPAYWALLALAALSIVWSAAPLWTAQRVATLAGVFAVGLFFATQFSPRRSLVLIQACLGAVVLLSAAVALATPDLGVQFDGAWRGVFGQKNWLGNAAAFWIVISCGMLLFSRSRPSVLFSAVCCLAGCWVLWQSASVSASVGTLAGVGLAVALRLVQAGWLRAWHLLVMALVVMSLVWLEFQRLVAVVGRDPHLTGRVDMWQTLWPIMLDRPWLGYGYEAYLFADGIPERLGHWREFFLSGAGAHNGFISIQLDVGLIGVMLAVLLFIQLGLRAACWVRDRAITRERCIAASLWLVILLHQLTEPSLLMPVTLTVFLLVYTATVTAPHADSLRRDG